MGLHVCLCVTWVGANVCGRKSYGSHMHEEGRRGAGGGGVGWVEGVLVTTTTKVQRGASGAHSVVFVHTCNKKCICF